MSHARYIANAHQGHNHLSCYQGQFAWPDKIYIATAFLKQSGLALLLPTIKNHLKAGRALKIIAGVNFGLTEPKALRLLFNLFKDYPKAALYLYRPSKEQVVFHPKMFLARAVGRAAITIGSANLTKGGLIGNIESSLFFETTPKDPLWKSTLSSFKNLLKLSDPVSLMLIENYELYFKEQEKQRKHAKPHPQQFDFNYGQLRKRLKAYREDEDKDWFGQRVKSYKQAKKRLNEIAGSPNLTDQRFIEIIDELVSKNGTYGLWHSGSLFRLRKKVYPCKNEFRELLKFIRQNKDNPAHEVFNGGKLLVRKVSGASVNYLTEIMMTYNPSNFANLNRNPIKVLNEAAGVYFKAHSSSFNGDDYERYCMLLKEINRELGLRNMLETDSFFNDIYWKLK